MMRDDEMLSVLWVLGAHARAGQAISVVLPPPVRGERLLKNAVRKWKDYTSISEHLQAGA